MPIDRGAAALDLPLPTLLALIAVAFFAGLVDAIAGGGGLLTLPALLGAGLDPVQALGTNKGQSVFGSAIALLRFSRAGLVDRSQATLTFPLGVLGSLSGAALVLLLDRDVLQPLVLVMLVAAGAFVALRPPVAQEAAAAPVETPRLKAGAIALLIGAWDGFFGPGTGTLLIIAFVAVLGASLPRATADAKVVNFASNLAAVLRFGVAGTVAWKVSLPMALGQAAGSWAGAHLAVKGGAPLIRRVVLLVVLALVAKLSFDLIRDAKRGRGAARAWPFDGGQRVGALPHAARGRKRSGLKANALCGGLEKWRAPAAPGYENAMTNPSVTITYCNS